MMHVSVKYGKELDQRRRTHENRDCLIMKLIENS